MDGWMDVGEREGGGGEGGDTYYSPTPSSMGFVFSIHSRHEGALALLLSLSYPTLPALVLLAQSRSERWGGSKSKFPSEAVGKKVSSEGPNQPHRGNEGGGGVGSSYSIWVASYLLASSY